MWEEPLNNYAIDLKFDDNEDNSNDLFEMHKEYQKKIERLTCENSVLKKKLIFYKSIVWLIIFLTLTVSLAILFALLAK
jgi:hypothetical protein